ncbi:MAG: flagellar basal body P-ring formation chaperone FlgA [Limnochordia bacterium]
MRCIGRTMRGIPPWVRAGRVMLELRSGVLYRSALLLCLCGLMVSMALAQNNVAAADEAQTGIAPHWPYKAVVTLHSPAVVSGADILLGAIADIATDDENLHARLSALVVGKAALVGQERQLVIGSILVRFRQAGIDEKAVRLVAPSDSIVVRTAAVAVPARELISAAEEAVRAALVTQVGVGAPAYGLAAIGEATAQADTTVTCPTVAKDVPIPSGADYDIRLSGPVAFSPLSDQVTVPLAIWSAGRLQQQVTARCIVQVNGEVAVLTRKMDLRETLSADDIRWEKRNLAAEPRGVITYSSSFDPSAWRLLYPLQAGETLTWDMVEARPNAQSGAEVVLITQVGTVQVTDVGYLQKDARVGERVAVKNARTGVMVYGMLQTPTQVVVTP